MDVYQRIRLEALGWAVTSLQGSSFATNAKTVLGRARDFENFINNGLQEEETNESQ